MGAVCCYLLPCIALVGDKTLGALYLFLLHSARQQAYERAARAVVAGKGRERMELVARLPLGRKMAVAGSS